MSEPHKSAWHDVKGLGGWVPIVDVVRSAGLGTGYSTHIADFLEEGGRSVQRIGERNLLWMRREDCRLLPEFFAKSIKNKILMSGNDRQELLERVDQPRFEDMELPEIFEALAADIRATMLAISNGADPESP